MIQKWKMYIQNQDILILRMPTNLYDLDVKTKKIFAGILWFGTINLQIGFLEIKMEVLFQKKNSKLVLKNIFFTIGKRYGDYITSVDVVNECISDKNFILRDGNDRSLWNQIIGPEYIDKAFFWAKQAFPKSSLVINDYNLETVPEKRQGMYNLLKDLLSRGVPVDTVGLQMHINIEYPPVEQIKETIEMYGQLGLNVIVTEMEVSIYKDDKETQKTVTEEIQEKLAQRYKELFECFKMEAQKGILKDVVLWGVTDKFTWKNYFPVPNRKDAPLLFDDEGKEKAAFFAITK